MSLTSQKTILKQQKRIDYDTNLNPVYIGDAIRGVASSDSSWIIKKITYDTNFNPTAKQVAIGSWDGRVSLTYS